MALNRDVLLKIIGALPDEAIIQALSTAGIQVGGDQLAGMDSDGSGVPGPKAWSDLTISRMPDDRPDMAKKDYLIEKLALGDGSSSEMPHDSSGGDYARPM